MGNLIEEDSEVSGDIREIERAVLSCVFFYYREIEEEVDLDGTPDDVFITPAARRVFRALKECPRRDGHYDLGDLHVALSRICTDAELKPCEAYLSKLTDDIHYFSVGDYLQLLRANRIKTGADKLAKRILATTLNVATIDDHVTEWKRVLDQIALTGVDIHTSTIGQAWQEWEDMIAMSKAAGNNAFLKTRYEDIDSKIKALGPGQFVVIASRPGVGKTTFALNVLCNNFPYVNKANNAEAGTIGIFSLEMTTASLLNKLLSISSACPLSTIQKLADGEVIETWETKLIEMARTSMSSLNVLFCDDSNISFGKIVATIKTWAREHKLKLVIIDYLQLINYHVDRGGTDSIQQYQKIGMISRSLKILAMELNICILSLAQLNRKVEERRGLEKSPILSDLRESGSIEQDADVVMFLYESSTEGSDDNESSDEPDYGRKQISTMLKIAKNRHGPVGTVEFHFDKSRGIYRAVGEK